MINYLVHVANVLFLASYLVRDILWLRLLTIVAIGTLIPYYIANELVAPVIWNGVFIGINVVQIYSLLLERAPVKLDAREERMHQRVFRTLRPREFLRLCRVGEWRTAKPGDEVVAFGAVCDYLHVIDRGDVEVKVEGQTVATLGAGSFVGEMSFVTGEPTSASVQAAGDLHLLCFPREALETFLAKNPDTRAALQLILGTDMASKLRSA